ncbi:GNAT family N-acetyltransferase [Geofilum sp. OHC36d9]|uniref:GNAT family N-acetyltransferase n=1 Tax=Geofilum sp. OHC36d9 TaxID=3458413 RepID=UPI00403418E2
MKILPVIDKSTTAMFLDVVKVVYKGDNNYVRPLDVQIEEVFNPQKNKFFSHGEAIRFVLVDDNGGAIGRVAAFINEKKATGFVQPTGGMGFFECINNREAAYMLFDAARDWLAERGMEAMDGPINFGENDNFWGLLVEGFSQPAFGMQYNPPYYVAFFESYGFRNYFEQVTNILDLQKPFPERFWKIAGRVVSREDYSFRHFSVKEADKFIDDLIEVYNDAWRFHENFTPMEAEVLYNTLNDAKSFMDEEMIWYAYHKDEPIAFFVMFPDINQIIKHFKGKMNLWNKLRFVYYKWTKEMTRSRVVIMGVKPQYQRLGIESGIFWHLRDVMAKRPHITEMELSWVGDFNPKMRALHESMGATFGKKHITYRMVFDPAKRDVPQRAGSIPVDTKYRDKES